MLKKIDGMEPDVKTTGKYGKSRKVEAKFMTIEKGRLAIKLYKEFEEIMR